MMIKKISIKGQFIDISYKLKTSVSLTSGECFSLKRMVGPRVYIPFHSSAFVDYSYDPSILLLAVATKIVYLYVVKDIWMVVGSPSQY